MRFRVYAEVETPTAVSVRRATGNDLDTQRFIPGTVLRGALAAAYLEEHGAPDAGFTALFLERKVRYGDLRIGDARPWPLSVQRCVAEPDDHPQFDNLLRAAAGIEIGQNCKEHSDNETVKLQTPQGYYRFKQMDESHPHRYAREEVRTHRLAHSEIDPEFLRAKPGQFHSAQRLDSAQTFEGFLHSRDEGEEAIRKLIGEGRTVYAGRGRSRGQGRLKISIFDEKGRDAATVAAKIRRMNETASSYEPLQDLVVFSCTLDSATLVYDRWLFSRNYLEAGDIFAEPDGYGPAIASFQRLAVISGWHATGRLPKAEAAAIAPGSCFLFAKKAPADREAEYQRLAGEFVKLEARGIGERLDEGFGEATFCRTIHSELAGGA